MFGQNEIVGRKAFASAAPRTLQVASIFYTLQGEGPLAGLPAVFVRLAKCNLACSFCDTYFDRGDEMSFEDIIDKCNQVILEYFESKGLEPPDWALRPINAIMRPFDHPGGEPTLQRNLLEFIREEDDYWAEIQIETNGTQPLDDLAEYSIIVLSPKCHEKDGVPTHYIQPSEENLEAAAALKFVVSADAASPYHQVPNWAMEWARKYIPHMVFISPMNVYLQEPKGQKIMLMSEDIDLKTRSSDLEVVSFWQPGMLDLQQCQLNHEHAGQLCMQNGFNLNLQMHLYASLA